MKRYLFKRVILGLLSVMCTTAIVMGMLYGLMDRNMIFASDTVYSKLSGNQRTFYSYRMWEEFGYLDFVSYAEYLDGLLDEGNLSEMQRTAAADLGDTAAEDREIASGYIAAFSETYQQKGYTIVRLDALKDSKGRFLSGGQAQLFAYRDRSIPSALMHYFAGILEWDHVYRAEGDVGVRKLSFTLYDPVYGGEKFSPAIIGNGTNHRYLLYFDEKFPWLHQNFLTVHLGKSFSVNRGEEVFDTMNKPQGTFVMTETIYPTGYTELSADDLHSAVYIKDSRNSSAFYQLRYQDDYTSVTTFKNGMSKTGYSFVIGILAVILSYVLALPISTLMAMKSDGVVDVLGTAYIAFISSVPALAYLFLFKAVGRMLGIPVSFNLENFSPRMFIMPVVSIGFPAAGQLMKWNRRYAADQMTQDYILFARACGYNRREILFGHVMRNAIIPIVQGVPASILSALIGAIITERIYSVPGAGNLLTTAINAYDNSVIIGLTLFYSLLTVTSIILGDILMAAADPRIQLTNTEIG